MNNLNARSIRFKLAAWYLAILTVTFVSLGAGIYFAIRQSIQNTVDKELRVRLQTVRSYIDQQTPSNDLAHLVEELSEETVLSPAAVNLRIADAKGQWIYKSAGTDSWGPTPKRDSLPSGGEVRTVSTPAGRLRMISAPVGIGTVQLGLPLDQLEGLQRDFLWTVLVVAPILLLLAVLGGFWISGRALEPVERITRTAERISAENLSARLPTTISDGDEIRRLAAVLNSMLGRLESAFSRMTQFTGDASHELRTPVAIIRTASELMTSGDHSPEEHVKSWHIVKIQTDRMTRLIEDLLTLARADSGAEELLREPFVLGEVVRDACAQMRQVLQAKGIELHLFAESVSVWADEDAIRRTVLIILDNACKATPAGGTIDVSVKAPSASLAAIEIRDTGVGISAANLPQIFERFYRADQNRLRRTGGSGLGLAIAKSLVERHGGSIEARSVLGQGTTFTVMLTSIAPEQEPMPEPTETGVKTTG